MRRNISVDTGKFDTKAVMAKGDGSTKRIIFRTKASIAYDENLWQKGKSHLVTYNDLTYKVGEDADDDSVSFDTSKKNEIHRLTTLAAIGLLVDNGDIVNLAIGCPISIYYNEELRMQYRDYLAPRGKQIHIVVDGVDKYFAIDRVLVCAESSGIIYSHMADYWDKTVGVIDIGGLNVNCSIFHEIVPVAKRCFTDEYGSNKLMVAVKKRMEQEFGANIDDTLIDSMKKTGHLNGKYETRSADLFKEMKQEQVRTILGACKKHGWSLDFMTSIFVGGSSIMLKDAIHDVAEEMGLTSNIPLDLISPESNFANADGFLEFLLIRLGEKII